MLLLRNLDLTGDTRALVNGSRGVVESLTPKEEVPPPSPLPPPPPPSLRPLAPHMSGAHARSAGPDVARVGLRR